MAASSATMPCLVDWFFFASLEQQSDERTQQYKRQTYPKRERLRKYSLSVNFSAGRGHVPSADCNRGEY